VGVVAETITLGDHLLRTIRRTLEGVERAAHPAVVYYYDPHNPPGDLLLDEGSVNYLIQNRENVEVIPGPDPVELATATRNLIEDWITVYKEGRINDVLPEIDSDTDAGYVTYEPLKESSWEF
jgi:hypothetical protein